MKSATPSILSSFLNLQLTFVTKGWLVLNILRLRPLVKAVNESPSACVISAVNESISGEGEWFRVAPLGEHENEVGLQVVDAESGRAMVAAFNSLLGKTARIFRGLPITVGHPSDPEWRKANPEIYAKYPHPVGRVVKMEMRGDEAWFKAAFNETGLPLVSGPAAPLTSQSPGWGMEPIPSRGARVYRPILLDHIGLTNFPQIAGTHIGLNEGTEQQKQTKENNMPEWMLRLLGLNAAATETEAQAALQTALNERSTSTASVATLNTQVQTLTGQLTTATNEATTAKTSLTAERTARAEVVVTNAINEGRIVEANRKTWVDSLVGATDFAAEAAKLGSLQGAINTENLAEGLGKRKDENSSATVSAINEAVNKYAKDNGLDVSTSVGYDAAFAGAQRANPALFEPKKA